MAREVTTDELARMIKKGFDDVDNRFDKVDKHFDEMDKRFSKKFDGVDSQFRSVYARLDLVRMDVQKLQHEVRDIRERLDMFITRTEYNELSSRLRKVEVKLGITR